MRVLIVEDEVDLLVVLKLILEHRFGIDVIGAPNAESGIELAVHEKPDLILMDLMLPGMSGFEAISILQATAETKDIPIVVISDRCWETSIKDKTQEYRCLGCIDKSHVLDELPPLIAAVGAAINYLS